MKREILQSTRKGWSATNPAFAKAMAGKQAGFSLVEVILSSAVFVLLVTALVGAYLYGQEATALAGNRARANMLAEEGLEAVRNIRDANFANLTDGTYGLTTTGNQWNLSGSSDVTDIFTRQIVISTVDTKRKSVTANVTWQQNPQRSGAIFFITYLTNWIRAVGQADGLVINTTGANLGGGNKELRGITLENIGEIDIVIDKITVTWNNGNLIEEIKIDGTKVWSKNGPGTPTDKQPSGTELNIQDFTLTSGSGVLDIDKFKFDGSMAGGIFTILFTLGDGTTKQVTVDLSGGGGGGAQADSLTINITDASIGGGGNKELRDITIQNTGGSNIVIDKITVTWNNGNLIEEIKIEGTKVWKYDGSAGSPSGKQPSGTELNIVDYTIDSGNTDDIDKFKFDGSMTGATFNITFTMGDGSTKSTGNFSP